MQIIGKMHMECTGNKVGLASRRNFTDKCYRELYQKLASTTINR